MFEYRYFISYQVIRQRSIQSWDMFIGVKKSMIGDEMSINLAVKSH